ncbi:transcription factor SPN1 [Aspergillus vadensis CBS 113365]|uniref:Transcription factor iws-1 n=1 Tax=Aspergillus vadensis (strain CBS 113365 / IMI 142717 / IBT 24658) TaxID=1448311 RepID=A0A319ATH3_ASPVC|nr:transcription factor iws-1 [Aspergillus vadensis CBS 113365]PYH63626.1 transcription factor iws-1 [Aspergillus vadensis CBS 113365]
MSEPRSPEPELKPAAEVDEQEQQQEAPPTPGGDAVSDEEPAKEVEAEAEPEAEEQQEQEQDQGEEEAAQDNGGDDDDDDDEDKISDDESILSEVDEAQFEDFDPENVDIEDRPQLAIDEDNLKLIGRHKRKRTEGGDEERSKRKREGRREKKSRRMRELEDGGASDEEKASRRRKKKEAEIAEEELLDPATRRRRALDRAMDEALKKPTKRRFRKADGIDLEQMADAEIEDMRKRMTHAAQMDAINRREGKPAMHKLKMLPEVVSLLNRNQYVNSLVDPEINLLEAVKFFLEPLDDGSLPAYNIQRDLMTALGKLPINKEALVASGIGKVIVFYTRSKRPEPGIKRMAERLLAEWTRPILQRSDDYSKRVYQEAAFDPTKLSTTRPQSVQATAAEARARELLPPRLANRARADMTHTSYTVVPRPTMVQESKFARPLGASGEDRFRKMRARQIAASKGSRR